MAAAAAARSRTAPRQPAPGPRSVGPHPGRPTGRSSRSATRSTRWALDEGTWQDLVAAARNRTDGSHLAQGPHDVIDRLAASVAIWQRATHGFYRYAPVAESRTGRLVPPRRPRRLENPPRQHLLKPHRRRASPVAQRARVLWAGTERNQLGLARRHWIRAEYAAWRFVGRGTYKFCRSNGSAQPGWKESGGRRPEMNLLGKGASRQCSHGLRTRLYVVGECAESARPGIPVWAACSERKMPIMMKSSDGTGDLAGTAVGGAVTDGTAVTWGVNTGTYVRWPTATTRCLTTRAATPAPGQAADHHCPARSWPSRPS